MSTKVSNVFTIATGENDPLKSFRSRVKTGENASTDTDEAVKQKAEGLKAVIDRAEGRVAPKGDAGETPKGKPIHHDKPIAPKEEQKQAESNYLDTKINAKAFGDLAKGRVAMPQEKQPLAGHGADRKVAPDQVSADPKVQPGSVSRQNVATAPAVTQLGKTPVVVDDKRVATDIPRAKFAADNAVSQPKVSTQAGPPAAKTTQLNPETTDNIEEREFEEDGETSKASSESKARAANGELRAKLDGLQASLGGSSGGTTDFETNANGVDPESSLDNADKAEKLGLHRYTEMSKEVSDTQLAAFEFAKVEKVLKKYVPLEKIVPNWKPDTSLVERVVADTEKEIAAAQDLLEAMRTRGKISPSGYGWSV